MERPCVVVPREAGERTRRRLDEAGVLDDDHAIASLDDGRRLAIPVVDADRVPTDLADAVESRDVESRPGQRTPADLLDWTPTYERVGDVIVLDEADPERARQAADAVLASDLPAETVVRRASPVEGEYRTRDLELLAGDGTETTHREYGYEYRLDLGAVYFTPRLATERRRVVERVEPGEHVVDMFAGVGPFAVPMADRGATVLAVDANPAAVPYLRENAASNDVDDRLTAVEADVRDVPATVDHPAVGAADRVVMNLPHSADAFLDTALALAGDDAVLHYYDVQHESDPFGPARDAAQAAVGGTPYEFDVVDERDVRSYAPHERNVRVDLRVARAD